MAAATGSTSPSYINRNGAVSVPADKLVSLLSSHELLALRATCREIAGLTAPHVATAFTFLQYTFTAPAALQSLMRIGAWCTSLVITLPNTPGGKITLPLRNEYDKQRVFSVFPTPVDTFWASDRYVQEKHSGIVQTADTQLFQTARDKKAWTMMFASLPALRRLKVETPGLSPGKGLQRTCVDEALMTLREVLERRERGGQIREFVYDGHAGGVWILDPMHSWNGRGVRKAWWAELVEVEMIVSKWSLKGFHSWERGTVERAWRGFLAAVSEKVQVLTVELRGEGATLECPLVDETILYPKLTQLKTKGFTMMWNGEGGLSRLLGKRAPMVVEWTVEKFKLSEGERMWTEVFVDWELMNPERMRSPTDLMRLGRKDRWYFG
ncbi:hypothetical protein FN846DRAFT_912080 [Sphaerosporella brunnea]|uniref:Uncharacterized protein n=1 Tax=Sphaerosporella brunnea TaxID=1250544 RepID=A0A5J5EIZ9_9PEZI|nr:hypothetical protein FN846DRAFT_912080 [Sphaerosporella brunnea]